MTRNRDIAANATGSAPTLVDAKGDIVVGTADNVAGRLAVGDSGSTLVADSSATTGLRWQGNFAAGKNKIINGDFNINQRNFTSSTTSLTYGFDRWFFGYGGGTTTYSAQTFTPGTAPVSGYEGTNFARLVTTGQSAAGDLAYLQQKIEDIHTLAGQTVTISFWAKAASGTPKIGVELNQTVGTGGSGGSVRSIGSVTISTSWARYSLTYNMPSLSGMTPGTNNTSYLELILWVSAGSNFNSRAGGMQALQNGTFDFWGVQVEASNTATAFQTATGTLAGELAACQRYYYRQTATQNAYTRFGVGVGVSSTQVRNVINLPVTMRTGPSSIDFGNMGVDGYGTGLIAVTSMSFDATAPTVICVDAVVASGITQYKSYSLCANNNTAAFLGFSAEL